MLARMTSRLPLRCLTVASLWRPTRKGGCLRGPLGLRMQCACTWKPRDPQWMMLSSKRLWQCQSCCRRCQHDELAVFWGGAAQIVKGGKNQKLFGYFLLGADIFPSYSVTAPPPPPPPKPSKAPHPAAGIVQRPQTGQGPPLAPLSFSKRVPAHLKRPRARFQAPPLNRRR